MRQHVGAAEGFQMRDITFCLQLVHLRHLVELHVPLNRTPVILSIFVAVGFLPRGVRCRRVE